MENFNEYFLPNRKVFLENISYETVKVEGEKPSKRRLGCRDTVVAQLILPAGVKIIFNRRLNFEPEALFTLSVSFGVFMKFNPERYEELDWHKVNIVEEFTKNCPSVLADLTARTTLLVAQITSSAGGTPLIAALPANTPQKPKTDVEK